MKPQSSRAQTPQGNSQFAIVPPYVPGIQLAVSSPEINVNTWIRLTERSILHTHTCNGIIAEQQANVLQADPAAVAVVELDANKVLRGG